MTESGLAVEQRWVKRELSDRTRTRTAVTQLLERYPDGSAPTALVAGQNFITIVAVKTLHDLDLHHRVALVGFDDVELSDVVEPGITVMPQSPRELGQRAAHLLLRRLGGYDGPAELEIPDDRIIVRGSGEIAPP